MMVGVWKGVGRLRMSLPLETSLPGEEVSLPRSAARSPPSKSENFIKLKHSPKKKSNKVKQS